MFEKHISKREKTMFYTAAIVIGAVAVYGLIIEPLWSYWKDLNNSILSKEVQLLKNLKILAQKDTINAIYEKYEENIKMKGSPEEETAVILKEVENVARSSNVYIAAIQPQRVQDMSFYKEYYVELDAEGDITSLTKFIYDLQNSKQILKVKHLQLNPKPDADNILKGHIIITKILIP
jgi:Tfp pilus assembly protein PilO